MRFVPLAALFWTTFAMASPSTEWSHVWPPPMEYTPPPVALTAEERSELAFADGVEIKGRTRKERYVSFTFDDGPREATTPRVLNILDRHDVPATFFVVGERFTGRRKSDRKNEEILKEIVERGHYIGNHTFAHKNMRAQRAPAMKKAVTRNRDAIARVLGQRTHLFRAPYGAVNARAEKFLAQEHYTHALWSIDSKDYLIKAPDKLRKRVTREVRSEEGGVILFHDIKEQTVRALPGILKDLEAENCRRHKKKRPLLLPVPLHYFMVERDGTPRPVPKEVEAQTKAYAASYPARCRKKRR